MTAVFAMLMWLVSMLLPGITTPNLYSLVLAAGFILYMTRFQIQPEEQAFQSFFV